MPTLRFLANEPHEVRVLGVVVEPDELVDVPEEVYASREWPASQWAVEGSSHDNDNDVEA